MHTLEAGRRAVALFGESAMTSTLSTDGESFFCRVGFRDEDGNMFECGGGPTWELALERAEAGRGSWEPIWREIQEARVSRERRARSDRQPAPRL